MLHAFTMRFMEQLRQCRKGVFGKNKCDATTRCNHRNTNMKMG